jgi:hypothetical protein
MKDSIQILKFGILFPVALVFSNCLFENESDPVVNAELRESCPENPFEVKIIPNSDSTSNELEMNWSPDSIGFNIIIRVYNEKSELVNKAEIKVTELMWKGFRKNSKGNAIMKLFWDARDSNSVPVTSGYYFLFYSSNFTVDFTPESKCIFLVNQNDFDKIK